jgi:hypothetical protein
MLRSLLGLLVAAGLATPAWAGELDGERAGPAPVAVKVFAGGDALGVAAGSELDDESPSQAHFRYGGYRGGFYGSVGFGGGYRYSSYYGGGYGGYRGGWGSSAYYGGYGGFGGYRGGYGGGYGYAAYYGGGYRSHHGGGCGYRGW